MLKHQTITLLEKKLCSSFSFAYFLIKAFQKQSPGSVLLKGLACNFMKKEILAQLFSCEFCEISKNIPSYITPPMAASGISRHGATK